MRCNIYDLRKEKFRGVHDLGENMSRLEVTLSLHSFWKTPLGKHGCVLVYRYTKEGNINELRHNSMYGYENKRNSLVYRYTRTAPKALSRYLKITQMRDALKTWLYQTSYFVNH